MASSNTTINQVSPSMAQKEVVVNANFDAASPAMGYGRDPFTTEALTWGWVEATIDVAGTPTKIAGGTIALTASTTNYLYRTSAGVVTKVTSAPAGWPGTITSPAGAVALYSIVTGPSTVTSYIDYRLGGGASSGSGGVVGSTATITFLIDGSGSAISTGIKGDMQIDFNCTINAVTLLANVSGSIVVDIWKDTYANYPPVVGDSITASAKPTLSSAIKSTDSTLTGWTKTVSAGDTLRFNVDSATTVARVTVSLKVTKT